MNFTHLHVHSQYSVLDGMSKIPDLIAKSQKMGMNAIALTDHGNMYGIKELLDTVKKVNGKPAGKVKEAEEELEKARAAGKDLAPYEAELAKAKEKAAAYVPFKPIVGVEAYCARRRLTDKDKDVRREVKDVVTGRRKDIIVDSSGYHLILLAKNLTGYYNLCKLVSISFIDGFYARPRIDKELLKQYHEGLIVCSACLGGEIPQLIMGQRFQEAEQSVLWFKELFGDDYYIEIQRHQTTRPGGDQDTFIKQQRVNPVLMELASRHNIKVIATNDVHFVEEEHAEAHDRLICLSTGRFIDEADRMHYTKQEWLKSPEQMAAIFADVPEALTNTQEIVDKVEVYDIDSAPIMPKFPIPEEFGTEEDYRKKYTEEDLFNEFTRNEKGEVVMSEADAQKKIKKLGGYDRLYRIKLEADYLAKLTWEGARYRYGDTLTDEQRERIIFELHIMKTMGFPGYFLIVMDYIRAAREELGVSVGPGRGSAAGSVVAYCLRITDVDPLPYNLLFERFLNPDRISLPDIDVDFDDAGREKVLDWVSEKYGKTHVAHIITYGTMAAKSAIADVGRVQRVPLSEVNTIKKLIPDKFPEEEKYKIPGKNKYKPVNLVNCYDLLDDIKPYVNGADDNIASMLHYAAELEDTVRQTGVHACGVIIGADDLTKFAPLATIHDKKTDKDIMVTQYDGHVVESVGLIKMDFLGLKTLTIIKETVQNVKKSLGIEVDIDHISIHDELTYKLFQEGKTIAVFQFESPGMQKYMKELKPTVIEDLIAMNALYRPGPIENIPSFIARKHGKEEIKYDIPVMEKHLKETYGITVYQEQVMQLSQLLAGFTRGQADTLRKAMGKKIAKMLEDLKPKFIEGGKKNGHDPQILEKIWKEWEAFASYAFNKSHATCYAWVAYQTAYLKAHYPAQFMAANLTVAKDEIDTVTKYMDECKALGLQVAGPSVNESDLNFTITHNGMIRCGLGGIKGVGEGAVEAIVNEREKNGPYKSIYDFVERVNLQACNKKTLESLATAGAFDCFSGIYREQILGINSKGEYVLDTLIRYGNYCNEKKNEVSLFDLVGDNTLEIQKPELPNAPHMTDIERLNKEKDCIGIYLSSHPLDSFMFEINELCSAHAKSMSFFEAIREKKNRDTYQKSDENAPDPVEVLKKLDGRSIRLGGLITKADIGTDKNGKAYIRYTIEDYTGTYSSAMFSETYARNAAYMQVNQYVMITGTIQQRGSWSKYFKPKPVEEADYEFSITKVEYLQDVQKNYAKSLTLDIPINKIDNQLTYELKEMCEKHKGLEVKKEVKKDPKTKLETITTTTITTGTVQLKALIHDEINHYRIPFISSTCLLKIDKEFYTWLKRLEDTYGITYKVN